MCINCKLSCYILLVNVRDYKYVIFYVLVFSLFKEVKFYFFLLLLLVKNTTLTFDMLQQALRHDKLFFCIWCKKTFFYGQIVVHGM